MELKILLTADVHLGMKFAGYPEVQAELSEVRFETLRNLVERANRERCNLFVVAGDLFDRVSLPRETVARAAGILSEFQGEVLAVLPGNHDYFAHGNNQLWSEFKARSGDRSLVLTEKRVYQLDHYNLDVSLYPAPCEAKHSERNAIGWVTADGTAAGPPSAGGSPGDTMPAVLTSSYRSVFHIGIAHGSLLGFSPDFDQRYYPMTREELEAAGFDLWLLGHTHTQYPENPDVHDRIFFPGTPEPDGFDCTHEGRAWLLTLKKHRAGESQAVGNMEMSDQIVHNRAARDLAKNEYSADALSLSTGSCRFLHMSADLGSAADLEALRRTCASGVYARTLLKLSLRGRVRRELYRSLPDLEREVAKAVFYLHQPVDTSELREEITHEDIAREFTEHSFPYTLLTKLSEGGEHEALQIAYEMIQEARR